jgi:hypothetical protein
MAEATEERLFDLVDRVRRGRSVVERDDQYRLEAFLDAARAAARRGARLSVIDTGLFSLNELELLVERKVNLFTSDETGRGPDDLEILLEAARRSGAFISRLAVRDIPDEASGWSLERLLDLARAGLDMHVSNSTVPRDLEAMKQLAAASGRRRGFFVYYHHGALAGDLEALAGRRNWLHFSDRSLDTAEEGEAAAAVAAAFRAAGGRTVVYIERGLGLDLLKRLERAGAFLNFLTPPSSRYSLQQAVEQRAWRTRLPARAFYLTTACLL